MTLIATEGMYHRVAAGGTFPILSAPTDNIVMLSDQHIQNLISEPKQIVEKDPARGYREEHRQRRSDLQLERVSDGNACFSVFIRQNLTFIENFSVGLRYRTGNPTVPIVTLIRYNGPHGEFSTHPDQHYAQPHVHRVTEVEMSSGSAHPQEKHRALTTRYSTFEECLRAFFADTIVENYSDYFPNLDQGGLFNGYS